LKGGCGYERDPVDSPRSSLRLTTPLYCVEKGKKRKKKGENKKIPQLPSLRSRGEKDAKRNRKKKKHRSSPLCAAGRGDQRSAVGVSQLCERWPCLVLNRFTHKEAVHW